MEVAGAEPQGDAVQDDAVQNDTAAPVADFDPFPGEPTLMARIGASGQRWWIVAAMPLAIIVMSLALEIPLSAARSSLPLSALCGDLHRIFGGIPPVGHCAEDAAPDFPAIRDYFSIIGILSLALTPFTASRQWMGIRMFVSGMVGAGSLRLRDPESRMELDRQVRLANEGIRKTARLSPLIMMVSAGAMMGLILVQERNGVFSALTPVGASRHAWATAAYNHWWAGTHGDLFGLAIYFAVGSFGLYLITVQNIVTLRVLLALVRVRRIIRFAVDPVNSDGYYGWRPIRMIASATYGELAIHGIGLAAVGVTLPHGGIFTTYAFAAGQWMIILVIGITFPPIFTWHKVRTFKIHEMERLAARARSLGSGVPEYERLNIEEAYRKRIEMIRKVPMLPYKSLRDVGLFAISVTADTYAVGVIIAALVREYLSR